MCLTDYGAVREVLDTVLPVAAGHTLVVLSTGSPEDARGAAQRAEQAGVDYLDAGLQTTLEAIGGPDATILLSGNETSFTRHRDNGCTTAADRFTKIGAGVLEHRKFWDAMRGVGLAELARIEHRLAIAMIGAFDLDISALALDMTNFVT